MIKEPYLDAVETGMAKSDFPEKRWLDAKRELLALLDQNDELVSDIQFHVKLAFKTKIRDETKVDTKEGKRRLQQVSDSLNSIIKFFNRNKRN